MENGESKYKFAYRGQPGIIDRGGRFVPGWWLDSSEEASMVNWVTYKMTTGFFDYLESGCHGFVFNWDRTYFPATAVMHYSRKVHRCWDVDKKSPHIPVMMKRLRTIIPIDFNNLQDPEMYKLVANWLEGKWIADYQETPQQLFVLYTLSPSGEVPTNIESPSKHCVSIRMAQLAKQAFEDRL